MFHLEFFPTHIETSPFPGEKGSKIRLNTHDPEIQDPYLLKFVDMNVDVSPNVAYIYLWGGTHQ
jgi:hypothetical protein